MIGNWLSWFITLITGFTNFFFSFQIIGNITFGSMMLYFGLIGLAVVFINNFFWGKANGH